MTNHTFTMTEAQAQLIHELAEGRIDAHKNWMVAAVERDDWSEAQNHAEKIREYKAIFAGFNMPAKALTAFARGQKMETAHTLKSAADS